MSVCVLICSHINYEGQVAYLERGILSIIKNQVILDSWQQTKLNVDIHVSISFENPMFKSEFDRSPISVGSNVSPSLSSYPDLSKVSSSPNLLKSGDTLLKSGDEDTLSKSGDGDTFQIRRWFYIQPIQKYQMEHLCFIYETVDLSKYDLVFFLDDDDEYEQNRIHAFYQTYQYELTKKTSDLLIGVREIDMNNQSIDECPDFWAYAVVPKVLDLFFTRIISNNRRELLKNKFSDCALRYFNRLVSGWRVAGILTKQPSYKYNTGNQNSVCGQIDIKRQQNRPNILDYENEAFLISLHYYIDDVRLMTKILSKYEALVYEVYSQQHQIPKKDIKHKSKNKICSLYKNHKECDLCLAYVMTTWKYFDIHKFVNDILYSPSK